MTRHRILAGLLSIQLFIGCWALGALVAEAQEIVLIGNASVANSVKAEEIKQIFLGKKTRWADDSNIHFALLSEKGIYADFVKHYIGKSYSQYRNYWKKQVFSGKGRMPKSFKQLGDMLDYISETEGAIGFMPLQELKDDTIKILRIE